jgi:hypothetical protein
MADSKKYNGSTWQHSLRKLGYTSWHDASVREKSKSVMPFASAQTIVNNGVTFVSDGMGRYTVNGTATADASADFDIPEFTIPVSIGAGGKGTLSLFNDSFGDNEGITIGFYSNATLIDVWSLHLDNRESTTYSTMGGKMCNRIRIVVPSGVSVDHKTVKPMLTNNSTLPSAYEPYWK